MQVDNMSSPYPTIKECQAIAKKHGLKGVIVFGFTENGGFGYASYGKDREHCRAVGEMLSKFMDSLFKAADSAAQSRSANT